MAIEVRGTSGEGARVFVASLGDARRTLAVSAISATSQASRVSEAPALANGKFPCRGLNSDHACPVRAAITGNRTLVLEAMMADPMAGQLAYDDIVAMTDEMLDATARWLPQFS